MINFKGFLRNERGVAMPMVITIVTAAVSTIAYLIITLLPQLQDEQKKTQDKINYSIFFSSLNDYVVHAIRERWCVNKISYQGGVLETDLLLSNDCSSTASMEKIVTFEGNLERILWTNDTVGTDADPPDKNTIMGLFNQKKILSAADPTVLKSFDPSIVKKLEAVAKLSPILTPIAFPITAGQIRKTKMQFRLSEAVLQNMNDQHPLFVIARNVRRCIRDVDITIERDTNNETAEEIKLSINIEGQIAKTLACTQTIKSASSSAHYTFYPRRLHTFSLIKNGDLDANLFHEYHGPVYVAGNLRLPPEKFNKAKSSVFYNSLTLGVYNGNGQFYGGKIKTSNNQDYTFEERGDPYLSKQDNYPGFRGLLGGLRLDAVEDKGMGRIFSSSSVSSSAEVGTLEACIDENQVKTKPSFTSGTILGYKKISSTGSDTDIHFGMTKKNRFKPSIEAPKVGKAGSIKTNFLAAVKDIQDGSQAIGEISLSELGEDDVSFSVGEGAKGEFSINFESFQINSKNLGDVTDRLDAVTKDSYQQVVDPVGSSLLSSKEFKDYKKATEKVIDKCEKKATAECVPLGFTINCSDPGCPTYTNLINDMNADKDKLKNKVNNLKNVVMQPATLTVNVSSLQDGGKKIINQRNIGLKFSPNWHEFIKEMKDVMKKDLVIEFRPYHFSSDKNLKSLFVYDVSSPNSSLKLKTTSFPNGTFNLNTSWTDTSNNKNMGSNDIKNLVELECPDGMSLADWNQDMSESTSFAWNYANTPAGAQIEEADHENLKELEFGDNLAEGHKSSHTKSVVDKCTVKRNREKVFGFYACKKLIIESGRMKPLHMVGTFIVEEIENNNSLPVYWHSVWDEKAAGLILSDYFKSNPNCKNLTGKTWREIIGNEAIKNNIKKCSAIDLVTNGPNNFTWTTVDPDIGLLPGHTMTSQKVLRPLRWEIREDSRMDTVK